MNGGKSETWAYSDFSEQLHNNYRSSNLTDPKMNENTLKLKVKQFINNAVGDIFTSLFPKISESIDFPD